MQKDLFSVLRSIFCLLTVLLNTTALLAQSNQVSGLVKSAKGELMPGVTVVLKGSQKGTTTDSKGAYSIDAASPMVDHLLTDSQTNPGACKFTLTV